jgi:hypothetical protein
MKHLLCEKLELQKQFHDNLEKEIREFRTWNYQKKEESKYFSNKEVPLDRGKKTTLTALQF